MIRIDLEGSILYMGCRWYISDCRGMQDISWLYRSTSEIFPEKDRHTLYEVIDEPGGVTHSDHSNLTTSSTRVSACPEKKRIKKNKQKRKYYFSFSVARETAISGLKLYLSQSL